MARPSLDQFFNQFSKENMKVLSDFYHPEVHFLDPLVSLRGLAALTDYYADLYENVISIRFDFSKVLQAGSEEVGFWKMRVRHKRLKGGHEIIVDGNSHVIYEPHSQLCIYHRDYFDAAAMLYENIPVLGFGVRQIKNRIQRQHEK